MPWPPANYPLRSDYTDATPAQTFHPLAHNLVDTTVNDIVSQVLVDETDLASVPSTVNAASNIHANLRDFPNRGITGRLVVACIGDSITEGFGATTFGGTDYVGNLRHLLQDRFGDGGPGYVPMYFQAANSEVGKWAFSGTWTTVSGTSNFGLFGYTYSATGASNTVTFSGAAWDGFELFYIDNSAAVTITYSVDGATAQNLTTAGNNDNSLKSWIVGRNPNGPTNYTKHTLVITAPTSGTVTLIGASFTRAGNGAVVHDLAQAGTTVNDFQSPSTRTAILTKLAPQLVIANFGVNDGLNQTPLATYNSRMTTLVNTAKALATPANVLLWASAPIQTDSTPITQAQYNNELKNVAISTGAAFLDVRQAWGGSFLSARMADGFHPNDYGHADIASRLARIILGNYEGALTTVIGRANDVNRRLGYVKGIRPVAGKFITPQGGAVGTITLTNGNVYYTPIWVSDQVTLAQLGFRLVAAGVGTAPVIRMAIYGDGGLYPDGQFPNTKTAEVNGTYDATATAGYYGVSFGGFGFVFAGPGIIWIALGIAGSATTPPQVLGIQGAGFGVTRLDTTTLSGFGYIQSGYSGTLPTTAAPTGNADVPFTYCSVLA